MTLTYEAGIKLTQKHFNNHAAYVGSWISLLASDNNAIFKATQDAQKAAAPQLDEINSYISEMTQKFITGEEPLTNFDNYMDQLQKMGIEDLIAAYQTAYDGFMAR